MLTIIEKETLAVVKAAAKAILRKLEDADGKWEQRRYELARDLYVRYTDMSEQEAVTNADKVIKELKKNKKNEDGSNNCI